MLTVFAVFKKVVRTASVGTRVDATIADAGAVARAVRVDDALRPARAVRIADVVGRADTLGRAADVAALGVHSARRRITTGLGWLGDRRFHCKMEFMLGVSYTNNSDDVIDQVSFLVSCFVSYMLINNS